ncbi:MAG: hypothetical protein B7Y25_01940 [Alphaproteobacteria bacterium 16-39-46]|nr:MAG: hypothetical protein B7Y25_01940 [Alphaproteobacteria bacterium 16-39-46]OZA43739.1 MAG: hypothetical protein B7X84_02190 [Alphaproteobacteria bacterium 17-39-52]HQS83555.1 helix-turn-helix transcriptional regulator [Alphaproteobacteria bacterium]HQS93346.1 helix-turn-helix transcriptional regulator [Alphaproteobacteria bacterium]
MSFILSKNHPTLQLSETVSERCQDFLKTHGFNYFQYLRCYKNGSMSGLTNDTSLLKYFVELDFPIFSSYREDHYQRPSYWFFWDEELPWLPVKIAREKSNFNHGVTFVRRSPLCYDMIAFALPIQILNPASFYMSKLKTLEWFIHWFDLNGKDLLQAVIDDPLLLPEVNRDMNYQSLCLEKKIQFPIQGACGETYVTAQELSCVRLKMQGYGHKDIARLLSLSPRTVETYLMRLKRRSGISSHADLMKVFSHCP